jgi:hypothetical protein
MNDGHGTERGRRPLAGIRAVQTIAQRRPPTPINPNVEFLEIPIPNGLVTAADNQRCALRQRSRPAHFVASFTLSLVLSIALSIFSPAFSAGPFSGHATVTRATATSEKARTTFRTKCFMPPIMTESRARRAILVHCAARFAFTIRRDRRLGVRT